MHLHTHTVITYHLTSYILIKFHRFPFSFFFFFNDTATTEIYTLSLHDALPISPTAHLMKASATREKPTSTSPVARSEEHTSELQSQFHLVCRLLLEKKKKNKDITIIIFKLKYESKNKILILSIIK